MKWDKARKKKSPFVKGHTINSNRVSTHHYKYPPSKVCTFIRMDKKRFQRCVKKKGDGTFYMQDDKFQPLEDVRFLRPKDSKSTASEELNKGPPASIADEYASVCLEKMTETYNSAYLEHQEQSKNCSVCMNFLEKDVKTYSRRRRRIIVQCLITVHH